MQTAGSAKEGEKTVNKNILAFLKQKEEFLRDGQAYAEGRKRQQRYRPEA